MTTDWLGSPPERGIAFALHFSPLSIAVTCTSSAMDEQDKVSGKKFDAAPVAVDRCTSTCPEQDVRYPKPGIKEISGGESALYQYWHISELEYSSTGYIVEYKYASLRVFGYASCLVRAFLGVRTLRRSQRGSARTVHMPQMQPSLDFSYLAARDYELLPIMDFSILRAAYLVVVVVTLSDPGIFVFLNGWPG